MPSRDDTSLRARLSGLVAAAKHRVSWRRSRLRPITRAYVRTHGTTVRSGPFAGLIYPSRLLSYVTAAVPKLMGSYERELHDVVEQFVGAGPRTVITAGCADGYYAVGLARRMPGVVVHAFDLEPHWRRICAHIAHVNGVGERVVVGDRLDAAVLERLPVDGALLVIDCDGCEDGLFETAVVARLAAAGLVVETHDHLVPGVTDALIERFSNTHTVEVIDAQPRWISEFPEVEALPGVDYVDRELAITEFRPYQRWLALTPRGR